MTTLDLSRLQFASTLIFHFFFVPLTIGLALYVAICQTQHVRTGKDVYARQVALFGKLMLISFAVGVVTGIIQEFQFGMNWSQYSRYVGNVFGPPLAMEGLLAFFLESTFIGLWIFGKGRLSPRVHLATIWMVAIGTSISAYFILAANSWMQHPVGVKTVNGKPELTSIWAVLGQGFTVWTFVHTIMAAIVVASVVALAVSAWHLRRGHDVAVFASAARIALPLMLVGVLGAFIAGDRLMDRLVNIQPMKTAAAEALFENEGPAAFSLFATGDFSANPGKTNRELKIPHLLSLLATHSWSGEVQGVNPVQAQSAKRYGPGQYYPVVAVIYWSFRVMVYLWGLILLLAVSGLWLARRGRLESSPRWLRAATWAGVLPFLITTAGWVMTEMGRQPWIVWGKLRTHDAVSPLLSSGQVWLTLIGFNLIFVVLGGVALWLFLREARHGAPDQEAAESELALAY